MDEALLIKRLLLRDWIFMGDGDRWEVASYYTGKKVLKGVPYTFDEAVWIEFGIKLNKEKEIGTK